jgi:putative phosphoesterase
MKICVFSDSHGYAEHMIEAVRREKPALCFFLGDGESDLVTLRGCCPDLPINSVRGNCDLRSTQPLVLNAVVAGVRIYAVHGHQHEVKYDDAVRELCRAALRADADVVLFGHTHRPYLDRHLGMEILNPGSIGRVRTPSYGLLTIENGRVDAEIRYIK